MPRDVPALRGRVGHALQFGQIAARGQLPVPVPGRRVTMRSPRATDMAALAPA
jgi:hypothetical protein